MVVEQPASTSRIDWNDPDVCGVHVMIDAITSHGNVTISSSERLGPELLAAKRRTGWSDDGIAVYCVEKLAAVKPRVPTGFLIKDLSTNLGADTVASPRIDLANAVTALYDLLVDPSIPADEDPVSQAYKRLIAAGLVNDRWKFDDVWAIKAGFDDFTRIIRRVISAAKRPRPTPARSTT